MHTHVSFSAQRLHFTRFMRPNASVSPAAVAAAVAATATDDPADVVRSVTFFLCYTPLVQFLSPHNRVHPENEDLIT
jgi:hypothetical protein